LIEPEWIEESAIEDRLQKAAVTNRIANSHPNIQPKLQEKLRLMQEKRKRHQDSLRCLAAMGERRRPAGSPVSGHGQ